MKGFFFVSRTSTLVLLLDQVHSLLDLLVQLVVVAYYLQKILERHVNNHAGDLRCKVLRAKVFNEWENEVTD